MNKQELLEKYPTPTAVDAVNYSGIAIHAIVHGFEEKVFGVDTGRPFLHVIKYTKEGKAYFNHDGVRWHLENFLRTNIVN